MRRCQNCSTMNNDNANYCTYCGQELQQENISDTPNFANLSSISTSDEIYNSINIYMRQCILELSNTNNKLRDLINQKYLESQNDNFTPKERDLWYLLKSCEHNFLDITNNDRILNKFFLSLLSVSYEELNHSNYKQAVDRLFIELGKNLMELQINSWMKQKSTFTSLYAKFMILVLK